MEKLTVKFQPNSGTIEGGTYYISHTGEFILKKDVEVYHGIYQQKEMETVNRTFKRPLNTVLWPKGSKVIINQHMILLENLQVSYKYRLYAIKGEENLQALIDAIQ